MNDNLDSNSGPLSSRDGGHFRPRSRRQSNGHDHRNHTNGHSGHNGHNGHAPKALDAWTIIDMLAQRWHWPAIAGTLGMVAFLALGWQLIQPKFTATSTLLRYETPGVSEFLKATPLTSETFAALVTSPDLLRRVGDQLQPPVPVEKMLKITKVEPQVDSDVVKIKAAAIDPQHAVAIANLYANEAVVFTRNLQATQAAEVAQTYLKEQVTQMDKDIGELRDKFRGIPIAPEVSNKVTQVGAQVNALNQALAAASRPSPLVIQKQFEKLQTALAELNDLKLKYTDLNPLVQQKQAQIDEMQTQLSEVASNNPTGAVSFSTDGNHVLEPDLEVVRARLRSLEDAHVQMESRQHEAEMLAANPPGMVRPWAPATLKSVESNMRPIKIGIVAAFGGFLGMIFGLLLLLIAEATDRRLRTADDVKRVTDLPVLTTLGDLHDMREDDRTQWAFRTWTLLQGRLSRSQNHGLVCGVTSSTEGEGRSTWISMLTEAASLAGFRVLTIATQPSPTHIESPTPEQLAEGTHHEESEMKTSASEHNGHGAALMGSSVLSTPAKVTEQLTGPDSRPVVHIPLPGWVWNLERRKEWREALSQWRQIENLVIFVELPPASVPESVLLGSHLPNLIWLTRSGAADAAETRTQLETLRNARCNLVGAVLNREPVKSLKTRFPRWLGCATMFVALGVSLAQAQETNRLTPADRSPLPVEAPANSPDAAPVRQPATNLSFSIVRPNRASWQQRLTLGPGDVLNIGLYGEPTLHRAEVAIAPDGRLSYLEAQDVVATGLTVDELRQKFDDELGKYRRAPRTLITPVAFKSKKYFMLGKVVRKGVYTLDRPITIIEALARADGFESGQVEYNTVDLADLQRAFLVRGGKRIPIDFDKLFREGDLSQNVPIEPDDYLYFPPADVNQVYVLGEVVAPGRVIYHPDMTAIGAISATGGFDEKAYKSRVLVVRGSLNHPETFVVDVMAVTKAQSTDFKLQPHDIVYVTWRPFYRAEELLDTATTAFIQSAVSGWAGVHILKP